MTQNVRVARPVDRVSLIHILRFVAAIIVVLGHLRVAAFAEFNAIADPPAWFTALAAIAGIGNDAVMVFFVISGWLVGGGLLASRRQSDAYREYAIARTCRLWTVLLPLFLMQAVGHHDDVFDLLGPFGLVTLLGNLVGLQTIYVPYYGGNFPLWSLANETAYYIAFALLLAAAESHHAIRTRVVCGVALVLYACMLTDDIRKYFAVWLIGALASQVTLKYSARRFVFLILAFVSVIMYKRYYKIVGFLSFDLMLSTILAMILCVSQVRSDEKHVNFVSELASFSFSLYVTHIPVIRILYMNGTDRTDVSPWRLVVLAGEILLIVLLAYIYGKLFEDRYAALRRWVRRRVSLGRRDGVDPAPGRRASTGSG